MLILEMLSVNLWQIARLKLKTVEVPATVTYTQYSIRKGQSGFNSINIIIDLILGRLVK